MMDSEQPLLFSPEILKLDWDILEAGAGIYRDFLKHLSKRTYCM